MEAARLQKNRERELFATLEAIPDADAERSSMACLDGGVAVTRDQVPDTDMQINAMFALPELNEAFAESLHCVSRVFLRHPK